jgi:hypothetical protein
MHAQAFQNFLTKIFCLRNPITSAILTLTSINLVAIAVRVLILLLKNVGNTMFVNGSDEELITILSIDGGGVRGIIPGTVLAFLESKLQVGWLLALFSS